MSQNDSQQLYIALDQGGHGSRALVFDGEGHKLAEASRGIETRVEGNRVTLEPQALLESLRDAAGEVCLKLGQHRQRIVSAGLATQRSNIACWDRHSGAPLGPILSWQDRRAPEVLAAVDPTRVHGLTGLFPNPHYGASKLAWCLRQEPAVARAADQGRLMFGPMASWLASQLGEAPARADPVNASRTLLWNLHRGDWDRELCEAFDIDPQYLPPMAHSRADFGHLAVSDLSIPLTVVTGDLSAAAFAHGRPQARLGYITVGTGAFIQRLSPSFPEGHPRLLNGVVWHQGEEAWYSLEGTVNGAGSAFSWLSQQHRVDEDYLFEHLPNWCLTEADPPLFLNGVSGLGSPFWQSDFDSRFVGEAGLPAQAVAVLESIIFLLLENLRSMDEVMSTPAALVVNGGLSRLDAFCQGLANLSGLEVQASSESEATAKGLAYLLAGLPSSWQASESRRYTPQAAPELLARYHRWQSQMHAALTILAKT